MTPSLVRNQVNYEHSKIQVVVVCMPATERSFIDRAQIFRFATKGSNKSLCFIDGANIFPVCQQQKFMLRRRSDGAMERKIFWFRLSGQNPNLHHSGIPLSN